MKINFFTSPEKKNYKRINFIKQVNFLFYISDDYSRVILKTDLDYSDYINANYIKVSIVLKVDVINVRWYFQNVCLLKLHFYLLYYLFLFFVHQRTLTGISDTLQLKVKNKDVQAKVTTNNPVCLYCFKMNSSPFLILIYVFF